MKNIHEWHDRHYTVTTDITRLDIGKIHDYLTHSAWAEGISRKLVNESILNSLCFGLFAGTEQIGFARLVTDGVTFGYLCDVYIIDEYQKQGLGRLADGVLSVTSGDEPAETHHAGHIVSAVVI